MLPPGVTVCPRDGASAITDNPFSDEPTMRRDPGAPRANGKAPVAVPPPPVTEAASMEVEDDPSEEEGSWEATVRRDVLVGKQIGDFVVKRRIGAGGMGIVYEGEHPIIGRKAAIKILRPEYSEGSGARDLIAEARAASAVRHRGIIDIFGFGTLKGLGQYLVMEYLEGTPLDEVIDQRAPMLEMEVIGLLDELLAALGAAHAVGVIHRDLKPGNIFVMRDSSGGESVKVLDFGLAKRSEVPNGTSPQTRASMIVGTPEYMAPEQATGNAVGPHTDLYSVGVIAFEMLTRRLPFYGPSAMAVAIQHVQAKPPAPSEFVDLHPALDELVVRLLSKTAAQRPASAEAVRRELKAISRELADGATRLDPAPRGQKPSDEIPNVPPAYEGAPAPRISKSGHESLTETRTAPAGQGAGSRPRLPSLDTMEEVATYPGRGKVPTTERVTPVHSHRTPQLVVGGVLLLLLGALGFWALSPGETPVTVPEPVAETPPNPVPIKPVTPTPPPAEVKPVTPPTPDPEVPGPPNPAEVTKPPPESTAVAQIAPPQVPSQNGQKKPGERTGRTTPPRVKTPSGVGTLRLSTPGGGWAEVIVDGKSLGTLPKANNQLLSAGRHELVLRKPGFKEHRANITISADETTEHEVIFQPLPVEKDGASN
jgi:serine/threonine protein kinase